MTFRDDKKRCYLCNTMIDDKSPEDYYCHGCNEYICEECLNDGPMLVDNHNPIDHCPEE